MDQYFWGLFLFACSMVASPGPANMVLLTAGSQFGLKKSQPFVFGIIFSKQLIIWPIGFGILSIFNLFPNLIIFFKIISCCYILFLAWKILNFRIKPKSDFLVAPSFFHGLPVHPTNPKAWAMVSVSFANYTWISNNPFISTLVVALTFFFIQLIFHNLWCYSGHQLRRKFKGTKFESWLMKILSSLMIASVLLLFF